ncbi:hypothetical protein SAMN02745194_02274 [Roseomonas rosea]|jgi:hypothetical protein|uniref:Uncharacterized protein n=1 Tax=Muricoccus roseus TaxID=198092 RepID=A0A1M6I9G8_9PROT|nr:hypothetical protein [Roseomonas rosea]SHJ31036.1 hypothetical protein SAMN02745194_02274 [Roseomonas rosea]
MADDIPPGSARVLSIYPILDPGKGRKVMLVRYETFMGRFYALVDPTAPQAEEIRNAAKEKAVLPMHLLSDG